MFGNAPFNFKANPAKAKESWEKMMENVFDQPLNPLHKVNAVLATIKVDVRESAEGYEVLADLPGFAKEEIRLSYHDHYLTIEAERPKIELPENEKYICQERSSGKIERSFYIDDVDEEKITAAFNNGVLKVVLGKSSKILHSRATIDIE